MKNKIVILLIFSFLIFIAKSLAQAGHLDTTFGYGGIVNTPINEGESEMKSAAIQSDGKIVAVGRVLNGFREDYSLVRYNTNGSLDNTFGTNGIVITQIGTSLDEAYSVTIQSDGKIVAAGYSENGNDNDFALVRYNANGSLDNTFGTNGIVITQIGGADFLNSVTIQSDGKIVAAGSSFTASIGGFALVRYNANGSLDNTFGTNGIVNTQIGVSADIINSVTIQSNGKIVAAGYSYNGNDNDFALVRYNTNGSLDNTFGTNGIVITQIGMSNDEINSVSIQSNGKIVAAGYSVNGVDYHFTLVRYNSDGSIDTTFGTNGIVITPIGTPGDFANSVLVQNDGKIIAAGQSINGNVYHFALVRYNSEGSIDTSFGTNGIVITPIGMVSYVRSVLIQSDGKIVAAGASRSGNNYVFSLARYNTNGSLDNTFGINGIVGTSVTASQAYAYSEAIQSNGKIVAAGYSYYNGNDADFAIVCYNPDGSTDSTFGTKGIVTTPIGTSDDFAYSVLLQSDDKIITAGYSKNLNNYYDIALTRYNSDGRLDSTFGMSGIVTTSLGTTSDDKARSLAIQNDGKIIAAGSSNYGTTDDFVLALYNSDGALDLTFGTNGIVTTNIGLTSVDEAYAVKVQNDGKIIVAGFSNWASYFDFTLVRYNTDGNLDNTFGTNGIVTTRVGTSDAFAYSLAIQSDGKIVVAGSANNGNDYDFTLVRYNQDGSLDGTFGNSGIVTTPIGILDDGANTVTIQDDGKIVAAGYTDNGNNGGNYDFACVRYNPDGSLDNTFGTNGIVTNNLGISSDVANSVLIQNDGNIVVAGYSANGTDYGVFTLVRYDGDQSTDVNTKNINELLSTFRIEQNYPNPFNPSTSINFVIPKSSFVNLKVYDVLGNEIATLVNEEKPAGNYEVNFNAANLSSGIYFYKIQAGSFIQTKKMILLK